MSRFLKASIPLLVVLALLAPPVIFVLLKPDTPLDQSPPTPATAPLPTVHVPTLSILGETPDWSELETYQESITRSQFLDLLNRVFSPSAPWQQHIQVSQTTATVKTTNADDAPTFTLRFAPEGSPTPVSRYAKSHHLPPAPDAKPLTGLHIAIDPGHIGGTWAHAEERWFSFENGSPVREGDMTLIVAKLLKPQLENLGAKTTLVRKNSEPVTPLRPESLESLANESSPADSPESIRKLADRLFYRTAEIRARADLVNHTIKPDLVLCLHFNADSWGDPNQPTLVDRTHFHVLLNGAYTEDEIRLADQRFAMLKKILGGTHAEELLVADSVATTFARVTKLPAYQYQPSLPNVTAVNQNPYLWARNLLANRLYDCPVIFMEPYVMNSKIDYPRIQAGDYQGTRLINGKLQPSIFHEYADTLALALKTHYQKARTTIR